MSTSPTPTPQQVGILVFDDNAQGSSAVKQILDSEGWRVRVVSDTQMLLAELKTGEWSLVIANVVLTGVEGHAFVILRELASVSAADGARIRVLYLIPEATSSQYVTHLEAARLPYVLRPYHLHDFLEKVSDLLVEVKAIEGPIRQVRHEFGALRRRRNKPGVTPCSLRAILSPTPTKSSPNTKNRKPKPLGLGARPVSTSATPTAKLSA